MHLRLWSIACILAASAPLHAEEHVNARADFIDLNGEPNGVAVLRGTGRGVLVEAEVWRLRPSQWVAFHIHEGNECDPAGAFETAGGHLDPIDTEHGFLSPRGPHAGDMPNQRVDTDGRMRAHVFNPFVMLEGGEADIRGRTLVVHESPDDYASQPSGGAGGRIACAVIR